MILVLLIFIIILLYLSIYKNKEYFKINLISDIVDQVYVINMDKDKDKLKHFDKNMKRLNIKYKRIKGVDGKKEKKNYNTKLRCGELGCLLSHINVLKDAIKNNYNNILIFEDDVVFHKNFLEEFRKKYNYLMKNENSFDLIYLGCSQKHRWRNIDIKQHYYKARNIDGTYAMIINKNIFKKILQEAQKLNKPIDRVLWHFQRNYKSFCLYKNLVSVILGYESQTNPGILGNNYYRRNRNDINDFYIND